jgi:hypothetical protein
MWGALSDERTGLSFARVTAVVSLLSVCTIYIYMLLNVYIYVCMHVYVYVYTIYTRPLSVQAQYSRLCPIINCSCYNGSLLA